MDIVASVIVAYLHVPRIALMPAEADPVLIVDANAVLAFTVATQLLEAIAEGVSEVFHCGGKVDFLQLPDGDAADIAKPPASSSEPNLFCFFVGKGADHLFSVARLTLSVKAQFPGDAKASVPHHLCVDGLDAPEKIRFDLVHLVHEIVGLGFGI